jgi:hypothetical protein
MDVCLEELCVLSPFSRPRLWNEYPLYEVMFRTVKQRPNYPTQPFFSQEERCTFVATFITIAITTVWGAGSSLNSRSSDQ